MKGEEWGLRAQRRETGGCELGGGGTEGSWEGAGGRAGKGGLGSPEELDSSGVCQRAGGGAGGRGAAAGGGGQQLSQQGHLKAIIGFYFISSQTSLGLLYSPLLTSLEWRLGAHNLESWCPPQAQQLCVL